MRLPSPALDAGAPPARCSYDGVMPMSPKQRAAQRTLIGLFRAGSYVWLDEQRGLCMWRSRDAGEWMQDAGELGEHLDALDIPYTVAVETKVVRKRHVAGFTIQVARADLPAVTKWVPSFQKSIDAAGAAWAAPRSEVPPATN